MVYYFFKISEYLLNNKNWIKNNFDTFSSGVNINRSNIHLFEESFLIHIKRVSTQKLKMLDGLIGLCPMLGLLEQFME